MMADSVSDRMSVGAVLSPQVTPVGVPPRQYTDWESYQRDVALAYAVKNKFPPEPKKREP